MNLLIIIKFRKYQEVGFYFVLDFDGFWVVLGFICLLVIKLGNGGSLMVVN
jgi:hypothetical protein